MSQTKSEREQSMERAKNGKQHDVFVEILEELKPRNQDLGRLLGADAKRPVGKVN